MKPYPWLPAVLRVGLLGMLGSSLIAIGRLPEMIQADRVPGPALVQRLTQALGGREIAASLSMLGLAVLLLAWSRLREARYAPHQLVVFVAWVLPLLFIDGFNSNDPRAYLENGWSLNDGLNPYEVGMCHPQSPVRVDTGWCGQTAIYPPLALRLFQVFAWPRAGQPYSGLLGLRLLSLIGIALLWWAIRRLAASAKVDPSYAVWLAVLNPLTITQGIGGLHVDLLMAGVALAGLAVAWTRAGLVGGAIVVGIAAAIKQPALLVAVPVALVPIGLNRGFLRSAGRVLASVAISVATFAGLSVASGLGVGWLNAADAPFKYQNLGLARMVAWAQAVIDALFGTHWAGFGIETIRMATLIAGALLIGYLAIRYLDDPYQFLVAAALIWAVTGGAFREWYLILWAAALPLGRLGTSMRVAASVLIPFVGFYLSMTMGMRLNDKLAFAIALAGALLVNVREPLVGPKPPAVVAEPVAG
ncbi:alpha-1,6-mannosyltransferase [Propionicimonas paludicola]|uniref:Alpha-1,6-mannosyltransferase n=1 Tax=Propionicimonas paludicola TaxID=185243 RepID=A0A2A9CW46_9ACTN|nr:polyprenol phosphomannose-dependent alpha 1,6 mannosyltransferase MptB [Propionicimonas paludicola]PFG18356.1 alpha-1,6-mannosyltransferase [Propionicimonas paludicola]